MKSCVGLLLQVDNRWLATAASDNATGDIGQWLLNFQYVQLSSSWPRPMLDIGHSRVRDGLWGADGDSSTCTAAIEHAPLPHYGMSCAHVMLVAGERG